MVDEDDDEDNPTSCDTMSELGSQQTSAPASLKVTPRGKQDQKLQRLNDQTTDWNKLQTPEKPKDRLLEIANELKKAFEAAKVAPKESNGAELPLHVS